jgi:hypothetical protein
MLGDYERRSAGRPLKGGDSTGSRGSGRLGAASGQTGVRANAGTKRSCRPLGHSQAVRA